MIHISQQRKDRARTNIERKLAILEQYLHEGVPDGTFVPKNLTQFRTWQDAELDVIKIGSPNTLDRLHNCSFKRKAEALIAEFKKRQVRKVSKSRETTILRLQLRTKDQLIADLTNQWQSAEYERVKSIEEISRLNSRVAALSRDYADLAKKYKAVVPLKPVM